MEKIYWFAQNEDGFIIGKGDVELIFVRFTSQDSRAMARKLTSFLNNAMTAESDRGKD